MLYLLLSAGGFLRLWVDDHLDITAEFLLRTEKKSCSVCLFHVNFFFVGY